MGGSSASKEIVYCKQISDPKEGETAVYRNIKHVDKIIDGPLSGAKTLQKVFLDNFQKIPNIDYLGYRKATGYTEDPKSKRKVAVLENKYTFDTFSQVETVIKQLGSGIEALKLTSVNDQFRDYKLRIIGIHDKNTKEWVLTDIANQMYGFVSVPLYDTLGEEAIHFILEETEMPTLFLSAENVSKHAANMKSGKHKYLKNLVILNEDCLMDEDLKSLEGLNWYKFSDVFKAGQANILPYPTINPEDISFFSYTSGTTGTPKGAMVSHKNITSIIGGAESTFNFLTKESVYLSYLPLAHVFERILFAAISYYGAKYSMFGGDVFKLKEDLAILKPTLFVSVPRLFNKFYDAIHQKTSELKGCSSVLTKKAIATKMKHVEDGHYSHKIYDTLIFNKMKQVLGGRVTHILSGSAPLSRPVKKFLKIAFACPFLEGYGQTEGLAGQFVVCPEDKALDTVGGPLGVNEFKLIDVPEMKYFSTDKDEQGRPCPRGELLVRGSNVIPAYFKNEEKTKETIDEDGWLHSGDIASIVPGSLALKIIDRRKNIFKLSQGEYIAPDRLEQVYKTYNGIIDIFIYGDSFKSSIIAILVMDEKIAIEKAKEASIEFDNYDSLIKDPAFHKEILGGLKKVASNNGLKGFERIAKIHIDKKPFSEYDLVTTTFKLKRNEAKEHFKSIIDEIYKGLD